ncbi:MAG: cysteine desulfurase-like protein, partial [Rhodobacteraceae bacterium]|nr:cysteine desulfurase-like protein [Paracoccaceae bacterium]
QVPTRVAQAIADCMLGDFANLGGHFSTSVASDAVVVQAHRDMADFLGADSAEEIIIGQSMTTLTFHMSRSICRDFKPGDEIIITRMDHEGNIGPWLEIAKDKGLKILWLEFNRDSWQIEAEALQAVLSDRTKLVCLNYASNLTGAINNIAALTTIAQDTGALVYVDAVQLAPHHLVDVQKLGCDFLTCSSYKFFGPHLGVLWGKREILAGLHPYKGRCTTDDLPDRFELGTPQIEMLAGLSATVDYFADFGKTTGKFTSRREQIAAAFDEYRNYEEPLTNTLIDGLQGIPGVEIFGITNPNRVHERVPTVSLRHNSIDPSTMANALAQQGIFVWHGHNYAYEPTRFLGLPMNEGVVRIGLAHYNTEAEVHRVIHAIASLCKSAA